MYFLALKLQSVVAIVVLAVVMIMRTIIRGRKEEMKEPWGMLPV